MFVCLNIYCYYKFWYVKRTSSHAQQTEKVNNRNNTHLKKIILKKQCNVLISLQIVIDKLASNCYI